MFKYQVHNLSNLESRFGYQDQRFDWVRVSCTLKRVESEKNNRVTSSWDTESTEVLGSRETEKDQRVVDGADIYWFGEFEPNSKVIKEFKSGFFLIKDSISEFGG